MDKFLCNLHNSCTKNLTERDYLEDPSVDVEVILKYVFSKHNMGECGAN